MLLLLLIPNDESVDIDDLIQGFGKELMARTPDLSMRLKKLKTTELFGIQGTVYGIDSQDSGVPMTIRIVGAPKNETSSLLAIVVYNQDVLGELELMVESLQISLP